MVSDSHTGLTTDIKETVGEKSEASPTPTTLNVHDMTEGSVDLGLVSVHLAVQHQLSPAQDMEVISQRWRCPAGVILSNISLVTGKVWTTEGQPFSAAQPGRSWDRERLSSD